jgi:hypothetical protein
MTARQEVVMPDNKKKRGAPDRRRIASGESYEVRYFAGKHDLTIEKAKKIIKQAGGNRAKADRLAAGK